MKKIISLFLLLFTGNLISSPSIDDILTDYCQQRIDEISDTITHHTEKDHDERCYLYGQEDAFNEILYILEN